MRKAGKGALGKPERNEGNEYRGEVGSHYWNQRTM